MPTVFCDLNFIITAHEGPDSYKDHLRQLASAGTVTFVLSSFHWVEAAEDTNAARGSAKADFMDSLAARWIYERRSLQQKEATASFYRFLGVQADQPQMMGSVADIIADLAGVRADRHSRDVVAHLRTIGKNHPLEQSLRKAFESNQVNGERLRNGRFSADFKREMEKLYVLAQPEMERRRFPLVKIPPLGGGDFQGMRIYRPMPVSGCSAREDQLPR